MSIVEMLIATAIGLFVMAATISLFVTNLGNMRRLNTEARVNQDMRTAAELVARDLRRAGFWQNAISGTVTDSVTKTTTENPYVAVSSTTAGVSNGEITYNFARDANNALNTGERFGFRLRGGVIEMLPDGVTWQPITNGDVVTINNFTITPTVTTLPTGDICMKSCAAGSVSPEGTACPTLTVRRYALLLRGTSTADNQVARELRSSIRVRNDQFAGVCPL